MENEIKFYKGFCLFLAIVLFVIAVFEFNDFFTPHKWIDEFCEIKGYEEGYFGASWSNNVFDNLRVTCKGLPDNEYEEDVYVLAKWKTVYASPSNHYVCEYVCNKLADEDGDGGREFINFNLTGWAKTNNYCEEFCKAYN